MLAHVAISRAKTLAHCVIEPLSYIWIEPITYKLSINQLEISANLQLYRPEKENRLDWLAQTTNSSAMTQINRVLSLNKRWDYNHGSLGNIVFTTFHFQINFT